MDPVLINLFMGSSQTSEVLKTNKIHVVHEELRGVPSILASPPTIEGRRNDSCLTETPAMRRGKLGSLRHRRKGKFRGN